MTVHPHILEFHTGELKVLLGPHSSVSTELMLWFDEKVYCKSASLLNVMDASF
jgi:hypothetical protein